MALDVSLKIAQSMSRVSKCIDNGVFEGTVQRYTVHPESEHRFKRWNTGSDKKTLDYYINHYPQKRLRGKTCGQVRKELLEQNEYTDHPIMHANRYKKY